MTRAVVAACARTESEGGRYGSRALGLARGAPVLAILDRGPMPPTMGTPWPTRTPGGARGVLLQMIVS